MTTVKKVNIKEVQSYIKHVSNIDPKNHMTTMNMGTTGATKNVNIVKHAVKTCAEYCPKSLYLPQSHSF